LFFKALATSSTTESFFPFFPMAFRVSILTVSDRCSSGETVDLSGPNLCEFVLEQNWAVAQTKIVPDSIIKIQQAIVDMVKVSDLILTTGGTGFGVRDLTPEAVKPLLDKEASGLTIAMMTSSLQKTKMASLSRPICGIIKNTIVVTLPGSVKGSIENIQSIQSVLAHALELCRGEINAGEELHQQMKSNPNQTRHSCHHHDNKQPEKITGLLSNDPKSSVTKRARVSPFEMVTYEQATAIVLNHSTRELEKEIKTIQELTPGYVIAEDVLAHEAVPGYRASVVDGYAVIDTDGPGIYNVISSTTAKSTTDTRTITSGKVIRITTGAPVPNGATAIVMVEDTVLVESTPDGKEELKIQILSKIHKNENIREIGSDIQIQELILEKNQEITSVGGEIGVLASIGISQVSVYRKPIVAILSTGNEVFEVTYKGV
jgi:gephyrin